MKDKSEVDANFLDRAKQLAKLGSRLTSPNPKVGAVIVSNGKIIGEGYHQEAGHAHAEVNALQSVSSENQTLIKGSTIYVSLEPCSHYGRTPPCSLAIVNAGIKRVVIAAMDPSEKVNGKGISILRKAKIDVDLFSTELSDRLPHQAFQVLIKENRPEIILKFAQSSDGFLGLADRPVWLTNAWSKRLVHRWRAEVGAIIVGTNTVINDDPLLTTRFGFGNHPLRIFPDFNNRISIAQKLFSIHSPIWILVHHLPENPIDLPFVKYQIIPRNFNVLHRLNELLIQAGITQLFVEGGKKLLESYLELGLWNEAWIFKVKKELREGIEAPKVEEGKLVNAFEVQGDLLQLYRNC